MHPFRPASSMSVNRFDEGYSEDTRSQNGSDMVTRGDLRLTDSDMEPSSSFDLPDWVMGLSENERSGKSMQMLFISRTSANTGTQTLPTLFCARYVLHQ